MKISNQESTEFPISTELQYLLAFPWQIKLQNYTKLHPLKHSQTSELKLSTIVVLDQCVWAKINQVNHARAISARIHSSHVLYPASSSPHSNFVSEITRITSLGSKHLNDLRVSFYVRECFPVCACVHSDFILSVYYETKINKYIKWKTGLR